MAQALENVNVSQNGENVFFCTKNGYTFPKLFFGEIRFSQKSWRKKQPLIILRQVLVQQTPILSYSYYKPRGAGRTKCGSATKQRYRKKKLKFWRKGRAAAGAHLSKMKEQYQTFQTRFSSFL